MSKNVFTRRLINLSVLFLSMFFTEATALKVQSSLMTQQLSISCQALIIGDPLVESCSHIDHCKNRLPKTAFADAHVLIFHKTNGYRHGPAINKGIELIESLGLQYGWRTSETNDASIFTEANLSDFDLVIWHNTSGNNLLNSTQRVAFENWIAEGGAFMGIHAATDTYRDKSWPFYNELVGGIVQTSPNHTSNNFLATMDVHEMTHPSVAHLGTEWEKGEEYYYWEKNGGQLSSDNQNLLIVRSTGSNSYDSPRPIAWYKTSINLYGEKKAVRSFYTALGHNGSDYEFDNIQDLSDFQKHLKGAIEWLICTGDRKEWTGMDWLPSGIPTSSDNVTISANYDTGNSGSIDACSVKVEDGVNLIIQSGNQIDVGKMLRIKGSIIVNENGTLVVEEN